MQRINLFPSPGFLNGIWGSANHTVDNGEMKVLADGGNYSAVTVPATGRDENLLHRQRRIALPLSKHERDQDHNVLVRRCRPIPGGACGSVGTLHCRAAQWGEGRYLGIQHDPRLGGGKYDVSGFLSGKGLSDPDRVGDLHARRLGGIAVNGSDVVRRGHDASSLALMGVMA